LTPMFFNWQQRLLYLKIVYYGPALSGKTTNLEQIFMKIDPSRRSELVSLKTNDDRTLFFDFMQLELGKICGLTPRVQLYTVPGQAYYEASRKLVLRGADGVVFVADSGADRSGENQRSWRAMTDSLDSLDLPLERISTVVQLNKRDLPGALPPIEMLENLGALQYPAFEAVAMKGQGVPDTLKGIISGVVTRVQSELRS